MITDKFAEIQMVINPNAEIYPEFQAITVPEEEVLIVFNIPCEGTNVPNFYKEIKETLNNNFTCEEDKLS